MHNIFLFIPSQFPIKTKFTICSLYYVGYLLFVLFIIFKTSFIQLPRLHSFSDQ